MGWSHEQRDTRAGTIGTSTPCANTRRPTETSPVSPTQALAAPHAAVARSLRGRVARTPPRRRGIVGRGVALDPRAERGHRRAADEELHRVHDQQRRLRHASDNVM